MRIKIISISILIVLFGLLLMNGCLKKDDNPDYPFIDDNLPDDNEAPARPVWVNVQPQILYSIEDSSGVRERYFSVYLEWSKVDKNIKGKAKPNVIGYRIYRDTRNIPIAVIMDPDITHYEDRDHNVLIEDSEHSYYVSAIDSKLRETMSDVQFVKIKTGGSFPEAPRGVFSIVYPDKILLYWNEPINRNECAEVGDEITGYRIMRREEGKDWELLAIVPDDQMLFIDGNVILNKHYDYQIFAITKIGNVGKGSEIISTQVTVSGNYDISLSTAPTDVRLELADDVYPNSLRVRWSPPRYNDDGHNGRNQASDIVAYKIYRAHSDIFNPSWAERVGAPYYKQIAIVYNGQQYVDKGVNILNDSGYYYYRVSAVDAYGLESDMSYPVSYVDGRFTTATPTPQGLEVKIDYEGRVTLSWDFDRDVDEYYIYYSKNPRFFTRMDVIDTETIFPNLLTGDRAEYNLGLTLNDGNVYYLKLRARDHNHTFSSNPSYYVVLSKPSVFQSNRVVLKPGDIVNLISVRSIYYAWYANELYGEGDVADSSFWNYDILAGVHYIVGITDEATTNEALILDPMGTQPPPEENITGLFGGNITEEIMVENYVYVDLSSSQNLPGFNKVDSVRPFMRAVIKAHSGEVYSYRYLPAYNDDGLTYFIDQLGDGVGIDDIFYMDTQVSLLQHGMEGDDIKLDYDVDPWTYYNKASAFENISADVTGAQDFWYRLYNGWTPTYDLCSKEIINNGNWDIPEDYKGGCAFFIGPESNKRFIARDYFGDWLEDNNNTLEIKWVENYFGEWLPDTGELWPGSNEIIFADIETYNNLSTQENAIARPLRKDNTIAWADDGGRVRLIDFKNSAWVSNTYGNNYDMYQEEFRIDYTLFETGNYTLRVYFDTSHLDGVYFMEVRVNNTRVGNIEYVYGPNDEISIDLGYIPSNNRISIYLYAVGGYDIFHNMFNFNGNNSPFKLLIKQIEFVKY